MLVVQFICDNCGESYKVVQGGVTKHFLQDKVVYVDDQGIEHEIANKDAVCHKCEEVALQARESALASRKKV